MSIPVTCRAKAGTNSFINDVLHGCPRAGKWRNQQPALLAHAELQEPHPQVADEARHGRVATKGFSIVMFAGPVCEGGAPVRFVGKVLPPQKRSKAAAVGGVYLDGGPRQAFGKGMYFLAMFMNLKNQIWIGKPRASPIHPI